MKKVMTQKFRLYQRSNGRFYIEDNATGKQESLGTSDKAEALRLLMAKSHAGSFVDSSTTAQAKYFIPFAGGLPSGFKSRAATSTGMSCGWQFRIHAACSTVSRAGSCPSSERKRCWSSLILKIQSRRRRESEQTRGNLLYFKASQKTD